MQRTTFSLLALLAMTPLMAGCTAPGMIASAGLGAGTAVAQERGMGAAADDASIRAEINHLYFQKDINDLFKNISIDVMEGRVMLTGSVNKPETAQEAVKLAWRPKGVAEVINEIETVGAESVQDYALDTYISSAIKGRMLLEKDLRSINYTVETVNQKAYILGIARNREELQRVATIASTTKYVKEVITHIILQDDPRRGAKAKSQNSAAPATQNKNAQPAGSQFHDSYDSQDNADTMNANSSSMYGDSGYTSGGAVQSGGIGSTELAPLK